MASGDFFIGDWLVQPGLDRLLLGQQSVHLRPKTMEVLALLAQHGGSIVPRDVLLRAVWADVHISDEGLTHCIAEIRDAFGDDAHHPRFVETVAKRGYRLLAHVRFEGEPEPRPAVTARPTRPRRPVLKRPAVLWSLGGLAVAVAVWAITFARRPAPLAVSGPVVLADWVNRTGDPAFDGILRHALAVKLRESPFARVVPRERVAQTLRLMRQPAATPMTGVIAREVCERAGGRFAIGGEISALGQRLVLLVEATDCRSGEVVAQVHEEARGKEAALGALDRAARTLRERLGEAGGSIARFDKPLEQATTANLDALRAFSLASDALARRDLPQAVALYEHSVALDPEFALAHGRLGTALANIREWASANRHRAKAFALVGELSEHERLYVTASYHLGLGHMALAEETLQAWSRLHPSDWTPPCWLAVVRLNRGDLRGALASSEAALRAEALPTTQLTLATLFLAHGRVEAARSLVTEAGDPGLGFVAAFLAGDAREMDRQASLVTAGSLDELDMRARQAQAAMSAGHVTAARQLVGQAESLGLRLGLKELTAQVLATQALWEAEVGNGPLAAEMAQASLSLYDDLATRALATLAFARAGAVRRAETMLARVDREEAPVDPAIVAGARRKLRAAVELAGGHYTQALDRLEGLGSYERGGAVNLVALRGDLAELGVFHLRGTAHLALNRGAAAAAEFQKVLDHRGISPLSPYWALAQLNLGRAHALAGDRAAARAAYERFLEQWRDADPDVPVLAEARREFATLEASAVAGSPR